MDPQNENGTAFNSPTWQREQEEAHRGWTSLTAVRIWASVWPLLGTKIDVRAWQRFIRIITAYKVAVYSESRPRADEVKVLGRARKHLIAAKRFAPHYPLLALREIRAVQKEFSNLVQCTNGVSAFLIYLRHEKATAYEAKITPDPLADLEALQNMATALKGAQHQIRRSYRSRGNPRQVARSRLLFWLASYWRRHGTSPVFIITKTGQRRIAPQFSAFIKAVGALLLREQEATQKNSPANRMAQNIGFRASQTTLSAALASLKG